MKLRIALILATVFMTHTNVFAQINYISQNRFVRVVNGSNGQSQTVSAPDFNVFNQSTSLGGGSASQSSTLSLATITASGSTEPSPGFQYLATSEITVTFSLAAPAQVRFRGGVGGGSNATPVARLSNSGGTILQVTTGSIPQHIDQTINLGAGIYTVFGTSNFSGGFNFTLDVLSIQSPYTVDWSTIDSGGGKIAAGPYEINTSIGQYDAEQSLSFRTLTLSGGFWTRSPFGLYCDAIDFNNDFSYFDPQDIDAFLSVYSEGPCIPSYATCNDIDFNNDGSLFDPCDIDSYLLVFSEGPCTRCGQ